MIQMISEILIEHDLHCFLFVFIDSSHIDLSTMGSHV